MRCWILDCMPIPLHVHSTFPLSYYECSPTHSLHYYCLLSEALCFIVRMNWHWTFGHEELEADKRLWQRSRIL
jgi:hypothetical protein